MYGSSRLSTFTKDSPVLRRSLILLWAFVLISVPCPVLRAEGIEPVRLTNHKHSFTATGLGWSGDDSKILFYQQGVDDRQLWIMNADGSNARALAEEGNQGYFGWSTDGTRVAFAYSEGRTSDVEASIRLYDVTTGRTRELSVGFHMSQFDYASGYGGPVWTHDSKHFVYRMRKLPQGGMGEDAFLFDVVTGKYTRLTEVHYTEGFTCPGDWSPDDSKFAYAAQDTEDSKFRIYLCNRDGSGRKALTPITMDVVSDPRWQPKGDWIIFGCNGGLLNGEGTPAIVDLWAVRSDGTEAHRLTTGSDPTSPDRMSITRPDWMADGRHILFQTTKHTSDNRPYNGIYLLDFSTGAFIKVIEEDPSSNVEIKNFSNKVVRSPDGRRIAFMCQEFTTKPDSKHGRIYESLRDALYYYDIPTSSLHVVEKVDPISGGVQLCRPSTTFVPSWSHDGNRLLGTRGTVLNYWADAGYYDLYVYPIGGPAAGPGSAH